MLDVFRVHSAQRAFLAINNKVSMKALATTGSECTNHYQEHSLSFSLRFANLNVTQLLIG